MPRRQRILAPLVAASLILLTAGLYALRHVDPYEQDMRPIRAIIAAGEQNWADEATKLLDRLIAQNKNHPALADRLLHEPDSSLVAEGMILAVQSHHPQARPLIQQHLTDHRWNWYLANNDDLAKQLLLHLDAKPTENWVLALLARTTPR